MGKIRNFHSLTPLDTLFKGANKLPEAQTRTQGLFLLLKEIAEKLQNHENQPFYTSREIAHYFKIPQTTVVNVFGRLEEEGYLLRLRSSGTILKARQEISSTPVRGVVGIVMWHVGYCILSSWREFYVSLEEELRKHHYLANIIFLGNEPPQESGFIKRLLNHNLDYLIWYKPLKSYQIILEELTDRGIKVGFIHNNDEFTLPYSEYVIDWEEAMIKCLKKWISTGIKEIYCFEESFPLIKNNEILKKSGVLFHSITPEIMYDEGNFIKFHSNLSTRKNVGIIITDPFWFSPNTRIFANGIAELIRNNRVLFVDHGEFFSRPIKDLKVDILSSNPARQAKRIALDIIQNKLPEIGVPDVIRATYQSGVRLQDHSVFY